MSNNLLWEGDFFDLQIVSAEEKRKNWIEYQEKEKIENQKIREQVHEQKQKEHEECKEMRRINLEKRGIKETDSEKQEWENLFKETNKLLEDYAVSNIIRERHDKEDTEATFSGIRWSEEINTEEKLLRYLFQWFKTPQWRTRQIERLSFYNYYRQSHVNFTDKFLIKLREFLKKNGYGIYFKQYELINPGYLPMDKKIDDFIITVYHINTNISMYGGEFIC